MACWLVSWSQISRRYGRYVRMYNILHLITVFTAFAVNLDTILTNNKARLNPFGPAGYLEPEFLSTITTVPELEAKADDCTKVNQLRSCLNVYAGFSFFFLQSLCFNVLMNILHNSLLLLYCCCCQVYVWHTQTGGASLRYEDKIPTLIETKK